MNLKATSVLLLSWFIYSISSAFAQNVEVDPSSAYFYTVSEVGTDNAHEFSFKKLGANYPFNLRGVDGSDSVDFSVRSDEFVTDAVLDLVYSYSPALLTDYSHINVLVNDEVAISLPVPKESAGQSLKKSIKLPLHLLGDENRIRLQLIGHYTLECEDPLHSSLWASISNLSQIKIKTESVSPPNDLSLLPKPFYDDKDFRDLELPFVFTGEVNENTLVAAGIVSSWFGQLAGVSSVNYPVNYQSNYPEKGNAIVFATASSVNSNSSLDIERVNGPTLSIQTNPNDPHGKLLYVMGRNADELKQAAQALVLGSETFSGQTVQISQLAQNRPRKPYDAPNWIASNAVIQLGEIAPKTKFNVSGYEPASIDLGMRVAPDLFTWRASPAKLNLTYRYTPQIGETNSALLISTDEEILRSFPLLSTSQLKNRDWLQQVVQGDMLPVETALNLPLERLVPETQLEFKFLYNYIKEGECKDVVVDNVRGYIDPTSTLDMPNYPHYIEMPDLGAFALSGFPFSRMADLSETVVVLSNKPSVEEVSAYLAIISRLSAITGYPAVGVQVGLGQLGVDKDKDVLVIAAGSAPWLESMGETLPALVTEQEKRFSISDLVYKGNNWVSYNSATSITHRPHTDIRYRSDGAQAFFAGMQSPQFKQRSVVMLASTGAEGLNYAVKNLFERPNELTGTLAVVKENRIESLVFEPTYHVGSLPWLTRLEWEIAKYWPNVPPLRYVFSALGILILLVMLGLIWRTLRSRRLRKVKES